MSNYTKFLHHYTLNPHSVRYFEEIEVYEDFTTNNEKTSELLRSLIEIDSNTINVILKDAIITRDGYILDGNLRTLLIRKLQVLSEVANFKLKLPKVTLIEAENADPRMYQLTKSSMVPIKMIDKMKVIKTYIEAKESEGISYKFVLKAIKKIYGETLYNYATLLRRYQNLPDYLIEDGEKFDISPNVLIGFYEKCGDDKTRWKSVISNAIRRAKTTVKVTKKDIEEITEPNKIKSIFENIDDNIEPEEQEDYYAKAFILKDKAVSLLPGLDLENYEGDFEKLCQFLETLIYICGK